MPPKNAAPAKSPEPVEDEVAVEEEVPGEQLAGDFVFPDGSDYVGQYYKQGKRIVMHGQGRLQSGSDLFEGSFENGLYKHGRYVSGRGGIYTGSFRGGVYHGPGEYTWPNPDTRVYRGMWRDGFMHGRGEFENFSIGVDQVFKGFCVSGQFKSSLEKQDDVKKAFLAEYGNSYIANATTWLRSLAEKCTPPEEDPKAKGKKGQETEPEFPPEVLQEILVPTDVDQGSSAGDLDPAVIAEMAAERKAVEQLVAGPFPETSSLKVSTFLAFVALFAEGTERLGQGCVLESLGLAPLGERLRHEQLEHIGQAVRLSAPAGGEAGALSDMVLLNMSPEYDAASARWKLVHLEEVPSTTGE